MSVEENMPKLLLIINKYHFAFYHVKNDVKRTKPQNDTLERPYVGKVGSIADQKALFVTEV
jgi:hypothetical protein